MTENEMEALAKREQELREQLASIEVEKDRIRNREKALRAYDEALQEDGWRENGYPLIVEDLVENNQTVSVHSPEYVGDYVRILRSIQGRRYGREGINLIPMKEWETFLDRINPLIVDKKLNLEYRDGVKEKLKKILESPRMTVGLNDEKTRVILTVHRGENFLARRFSGVRTIKEGTYWIMRAELPTIWMGLENEDKVEWSDEAREACIAEQTKRERLDEIALADDVELEGVSFKTITLRPFQRKGIKWLEIADYKGWLGDQMGLGKTVQFLGAFQRLRYNVKPTAKALVVCPAKLKANWVREIHKETDFRVFTLTGKLPSNYQLKRLMVTKDWDIVIINYDILGYNVKTFTEDKTGDLKVISDIERRYPWVEFLNLMKWDIAAFDEAHKAKNMDANRTKAIQKLNIESDRLIPLTGTPLLSRRKEMFSMLHKMYPELFPSYDGFIWQYEDRNTEQLRYVLKPILLRRTKKEVMADLPPINRIYEWHDLSDEARANYQNVLNGIYTSLSAWHPGVGTTQKEVPSILAQIMRLKQICAMDSVEETADLALNLSDADENGGKVLIFTQFKQTAKEIAKRLMPESVTYHGDFSMYDRGQIEKKFVNDPDVKFFVATWQTAGEGLNLQCANNVVFNDLGWTPAEHQQAEERAYGRLADPHPINSYYVVKNTKILMWIQELLNEKLAIIESTIEGLDIERSKSITSGLLQKMKASMRKGEI